MTRYLTTTLANLAEVEALQRVVPRSEQTTSARNAFTITFASVRLEALLRELQPLRGWTDQDLVVDNLRIETGTSRLVQTLVLPASRLVTAPEPGPAVPTTNTLGEEAVPVPTVPAVEAAPRNNIAGSETLANMRNRLNTVVNNIGNPRAEQNQVPAQSTRVTQNQLHPNRNYPFLPLEAARESELLEEPVGVQGIAGAEDALLLPILKALSRICNRKVVLQRNDLSSPAQENELKVHVLGDAGLRAQQSLATPQNELSVIKLPWKRLSGGYAPNRNNEEVPVLSWSGNDVYILLDPGRREFVETVGQVIREWVFSAPSGEELRDVLDGFWMQAETGSIEGLGETTFRDRTDRLVEINSRLAALQAEMRLLIAEQSSLGGQLLVFTENEWGTVGQQLLDILKLPGVVSVQLKDNNLVITTERVVLKGFNRAEGSEEIAVDLGAFQVNVDIPQCRYTVSSLDHPEDGYPHPHLANGSPCMGNIASMIEESLNARRLADTTQLIIGHLYSYNVNSPYRTLEAYPRSYRVPLEQAGQVPGQRPRERR